MLLGLSTGAYTTSVYSAIRVQRFPPLEAFYV